MLRVQCLHMGGPWPPHTDSCIQHGETPSLWKGSRRESYRHTERRLWHALQWDEHSTQDGSIRFPLSLLGLNYRTPRFSSPLLTQDEMMERKAQYLCDDVAILCVDLGDGADVPDHTQYFIDLRREWGSEVRDRGLQLPVHQHNPVPNGHRGQKWHHILGASTSCCFYRPRGQCFWPHAAERNLQ